MNNINAMKTEISGNEPIEKAAKGGKQSVKGFFGAALRYIKFAKLELIIIVTAVFLDLLTKFLINAYIEVEDRVVLIKNFLQFYNTHNDAAAFGSSFGLDRLLSPDGIMTFFIIFSSITTCVFCYILYHFRNQGRYVRISLALIISGAFGNLFDRIKFGYVRDFVEFVFFGYEFPIIGGSFAIFNIADAALVIGMIMLMVFFIFIYKNPESDKDKKKKKIIVSLGDKAQNLPDAEIAEKNIKETDITKVQV